MISFISYGRTYMHKNGAYSAPTLSICDLYNGIVPVVRTNDNRYK